MNKINPVCWAISIYFLVFTAKSSCGTGCSYCSGNYCFQCMSGYYKSYGLCYSCYYKCKTCSEHSDCTSCYSGYYNSSSWCYSSCQSGCKTCNPDSTCTQCYDGYYLQSNQCFECPFYPQSCQNSSSDDYQVKVGVGVGVGVGVVAMITAIIICKKCKSTTFRFIKDLFCDGTIQNQPKFNSAQTCTICQCESVNMLTQCKHVFHIACLKEWAERNPICPLCIRHLTSQKVRLYCLKCLTSYWEANINEIKSDYKFYECKICQKS